MKEARGEFFLTLDSDDACVPEALERFKFHWDSIPIKQKEFFSGVSVLCMDQNGKVVGDRFPFQVTDSNLLEIYYRYKVRGEKWGFQHTDILRQYPFQEINNARFIPEGLVWNVIARSYKVRFVNEILRIYWIHRPNDPHQITQSLSNSFNSVGSALYYESCLNNDVTWFCYAPLEFIRSAIHYIRFSLHSGKGTIQMFRNIRPVVSKILVLLAIPIGAFLYAFEKRDINIISACKLLFKRA